MNLAVLENVFKHWKSTLRGVVTSIATICGTLLAVKANPNVDPELLPLINFMPSRWMVYIGLIAALIRLVTGAFSKDADKQLANVPGKAEPEVVPAHLVPDDPKNKPVIPLLLCLLALPLLSGCVKATSGTPAVAPDPYTRAASAMNDVMTYGRLAQDTEIALYNSGVISRDAHKTAQTAFLTLSQAEPEITTLIASQASAVTIQAKVKEALWSIQVISSAVPNTVPGGFANALRLVTNSFNNILIIMEISNGFQTTGGIAAPAFTGSSGSVSRVSAYRQHGKFEGAHLRRVLRFG